MKKTILTIAALLMLAANAEAKSLAATTAFAPTTDTVYAAVTNNRTEINAIYGYLNSLYQMQAASTCPGSGNATYDLCLDTDGPALKYWDGDTWELLSELNDPSFDSGLTLKESATGMTENCVLEWSSSSAVKLVGTTALPCTLSAAGEIVQVTTTLTHSVSGEAAGTYYFYAKQTGSTDGFTLDHDAVMDTTKHYLGKVVLSATSTIAQVTPFHNDNPTKQKLVNAFFVYRDSTTNITTSPTKMDYSTQNTIDNPEFSLTNDAFTPLRAGWYEVEARLITDVAVAATVFLNILKNGAAIATTQSVVTYDTMSLRTYVYMNGTSDYLEVQTSADATVATADYNYVTDNCFFGRWIGEQY